MCIAKICVWKNAKLQNFHENLGEHYFHEGYEKLTFPKVSQKKGKTGKESGAHDRIASPEEV